MIAFSVSRLPVFSWLSPSAQPASPLSNSANDDLRREYVTRVIAAEGCVGEYGIQALMSVFPKDF